MNRTRGGLALSASAAALAALLSAAPAAAISEEDLLRTAVLANNAFAVDLYHQLGRVEGNLFFSPCSMYTTLAMVVEGACGETAAEIGKVLHFPDAARRTGYGAQIVPWQTSLIHTGMATLRNRLTPVDEVPMGAPREEVAAPRAAYQVAPTRARRSQREGARNEHGRAAAVRERVTAKPRADPTQVDQCELRIANALWGEKTCPFIEAYVRTIAKYYKTGGVLAADFRNSFPSERDRINDWVARLTEGRISEIMPMLPLDQARLVRLILASAIYFKAAWSEPFDEANTMPRDFHLPDGRKVRTPMMSAPGLEAGSYAAFNADASFFQTPTELRPGEAADFYPREDGFAVLELPYRGVDLSMLLVAPNSVDGLAAIEAKLTPDNLTIFVQKLQQREVRVFLPRFRLDTDYTMAEALRSMGMTRAFTDPLKPNGADLSGMSASTDPRKQLFVSKVLHRTFIEVNEAGTEAAAVTAAAMQAASMPDTPPFIPTFRADRSFLFLIRHRPTGSIVFMGRMSNPER